jgi:hypothetical protein
MVCGRLEMVEKGLKRATGAGKRSVYDVKGARDS